METKEGEALVAMTMKIDILKASLNVTPCLEKLVTRLDGITIALDLASARIRDDIGDDGNGEGPVANPIEQSLVDLEAHERGLLSDYERSAPSAYKKTIWGVGDGSKFAGTLYVLPLDASGSQSSRNYRARVMSAITCFFTDQ